MGDKGTKGDKTLGQADTPSRRGTMGDKGRKDPREGGRHTIQQRATRRGTMGDRTFGKARAPSNKGKQ